MTMHRTPGQPVPLTDAEIAVIRQKILQLMQRQVAALPAGHCFLVGLEWGLVLMAQSPWIGTELIEALCTMGEPQLDHEPDWRHRQRAAHKRALAIVELAKLFEDAR